MFLVLDVIYCILKLKMATLLELSLISSRGSLLTVPEFTSFLDIIDENWDSMKIQTMFPAIDLIKGYVKVNSHIP